MAALLSLVRTLSTTEGQVLSLGETLLTTPPPCALPEDLSETEILLLVQLVERLQEGVSLASPPLLEETLLVPLPLCGSR
jgi:hypothetical protein